MKRWVKLFCVLFFIGVLVVTSLYNYFFTSCPEMNMEYFKWFPYKTNDVLIFESDEKEEISLEIFFIKFIHTDAYMNFAKCGHCEDSVQIIFTNEKDTLDVTMNNLNNSKSYFGYSLSIYNNQKECDYLEKDTIINNIKSNCILSEKFLFLKKKGLIQYKYEGKKYHLKKIIRKGKNIEINKGNC
tara:strand:+ start:458 stop:1012 length:555 start_codon:yes stop_codon:yes gene_type:complete